MPTSEFERFPSPLRYPGGKGKISNFLKLLFLQNGFVGYDYVEPFAGGASVALSLLYEEYANCIRINDLDAGVYSFWQAVLNEPDQLCERIAGTPVTMDTWKHQRSKHSNAMSQDRVGIDLAFATFFLNRTNRSGIIQGGPIGGKKQDGRWKLDARFNKQNLCSRIRKLSRYRERVIVTRMNAEDFLRSLPQDIDRFIYLDPPYFGKGAELYANWYAKEDHASLAEQVASLYGPWLVSYDRVPDVSAFYSGQRFLEYELSYSAQERYKGSEVMYISQGIELPDVASPTNVPSQKVDEVRLSALV